MGINTRRKLPRKTKRGVKQKIDYDGIECDSFSEKCCLYWLYELQEAGYIKNIKRSPTYILFQPVTRTYIERLKTKANTKQETLLEGCVYTPDFFFELTEKGEKFELFSDINSQNKLRRRETYNIIFQEIGGRKVAHIEVKGTMYRTSKDTTEKFSVTKKWLWEKHGVYTNLFQPDKVFPLTFTPKLYLVTDKKGEKRKIKWKVNLLHEYAS